jgi:hypothetical protein
MALPSCDDFINSYTAYPLGLLELRFTYAARALPQLRRLRSIKSTREYPAHGLHESVNETRRQDIQYTQGSL